MAAMKVTVAQVSVLLLVTWVSTLAIAFFFGVSSAEGRDLVSFSLVIWALDAGVALGNAMDRPSR